MAETTVYSIFAGYVPQFGFSRDDFKMGRAAGTKRTYEHGSQYDGDSRKLSGIVAGLHTDGKLGVTRVRGSIAWYEYSTKIRDIGMLRKLRSSSDALKEEMKELAQQWYSGGAMPGWRQTRDNRNEQLLNAFQEIIGFQNLQPTGEVISGASKGEPEEQSLKRIISNKGPSQWKEDDATLRNAGRIFGSANAIDVYFRDKTGKIHRLDVTAMTLDLKEAHHGLTSWEDRKDAHVTGAELIKTIEQKGLTEARRDLQTYFERVRKDNWNPPIQAMKDVISRHKLPGSDLLAQLKRGDEQLDALTKEAKEKMAKLGISLRGGDTSSKGTRPHTQYESVKTDKPEGMKQAFTKAGDPATKEAKGSGGWQSAANTIRKWYAEQASAIARGAPNQFSKIGLGEKGHKFPMGGGDAFNSGLEFALHMLGNIMELFSNEAGNRSARQGGYSTAYSMGKGAAANFVVEVQHNIYASGRKVFEFKKVHLKDVFIHSEAALTTAYQKQYWYEGKKDQQALVIANAIRQNHLATLNSFGNATTSVEIGALQRLAHEGLARSAGMPVHMAGSAGKVIPRVVNSTIDTWLQGVTPRGGDKIMKTALRSTLDTNLYQFAHTDDYRRQQGALKAGGGMVPGIQKRRERDKNLPASQSILGKDPFSNRDPDGSYLRLWQDSMAQSGQGNVSEKQFRARMGLEGRKGSQAHTQYQQLKKFLLSKDTGLQTQGLAMGKGISDTKWKRSAVKGQELQFWATPYLSVLYPSTQVRVKD